MKKDRGNYYQNVNQGYNNPGMYYPPNGYNMNTQYSAYGPNVLPEQMNNNSYYENDLEEKINDLEHKIKKLDIRVQKLESESTSTNENVYMI